MDSLSVDAEIFDHSILCFFCFSSRILRRRTPFSTKSSRISSRSSDFFLRYPCELESR